MKKTLRKLIAIVAVFAVFSVAPVFAQEGGQITEGGSGFRLSPTREDITIERGEVKTTTVFVRNVSATTQPARAVVDDFAADENESGSPKLLVGEDAVEDYKYSIKPFVLAINDVSLEPGEEKEIPVTFSIPDDASPGSYFGLLRFEAIEDDVENDSDTAVALSASVGTIYLINVPGETVNLLNVTDVFATKDGSSGSFFSSAPDTSVVRIENTGNTFQAPFGKVLVKNWSGDVVYEYEINQTTPPGNVLPDSTRRFEQELENIGSFGRYTIEANLSYGEGGNLISASTTFWVIPWATVLIVLSVIVALVFFGTRGLKAYNKRVVEQSKGTRVKKK